MARMKTGVIKREYSAESADQLTQKKSQLREVTRPESIEDKLAKDRMFYKNKFFPELKAKYPQNPELWHVDKYYPLAEGGPLAVDNLNRIQVQMGEVNLSEKKREVFREMNQRYLIITPDKTELQCLEEIV